MFGIYLGLLSAAAYGLIPLFTLPLLDRGIPAETIIVYRFVIATIAMFPIVFFQKHSLKLSKSAFLRLAVLSGSYLFAVIAFFHSFRYLPSSIAATIQFLYPVMVMLIMILFFHEKFRWLVALAVALGLGGVIFLSLGATPPDNPEIPGHILWGVSLSLLAGLGNSLYMVGLQIIKLPRMDGLVITFYVMVFGTFYAFLNAVACDALVIIDSFYELLLAFLLAVVTAVISNLALVLAIKRIGSTLAAILGVMEPLTAVGIGVTVFNEPFTLPLFIGIVLITASVLVAILTQGQRIQE